MHLFFRTESSPTNTVEFVQFWWERTHISRQQMYNHAEVTREAVPSWTHPNDTSLVQFDPTNSEYNPLNFIGTTTSVPLSISTKTTLLSNTRTPIKTYMFTLFIECQNHFQPARAVIMSVCTPKTVRYQHTYCKLWEIQCKSAELTILRVLCSTCCSYLCGCCR